jgi:hypothetical protein
VKLLLFYLDCLDRTLLRGIPTSVLGPRGDLVNFGDRLIFLHLKNFGANIDANTASEA